MPYIVIFATIVVLAFFLIPVFPQMIPAELNGQVSQLTRLFALFGPSLDPACCV